MLSKSKSRERDSIGNAISDLRRCVYCLVEKDDKSARIFFDHAMVLLKNNSHYFQILKQLSMDKNMVEAEQLRIADKVLTYSNIMCDDL